RPPGASNRAAHRASRSCRQSSIASRRSIARAEAPINREHVARRGVVPRQSSHQEDRMQDLSGKRIAILATDGFEQSELLLPRDELVRANARVEVIAPNAASIRGWNHDHWDKEVKVDRPLADARPEDYDVLVLPGGQIN